MTGLAHHGLGVSAWTPGHEGRGFLYATAAGDGLFAWKTVDGRPGVGHVVSLARKRTGFDGESIVATVRLNTEPPHDVSDRHETDAGAEIIRRIQAIDQRIAPARMEVGRLHPPVPDERGVLVRRLRVEDEAAVERVLCAAGWTSDQAAAQTDVFGESDRIWGSRVFVAEIDGLIGGVAHVDIDYAWKREAELRLVVVVPEFRRRGIAGRLLAEVEEFVRQKGSPAVDAELRLDSGSAPTEHLLSGRGYSVVARFPVVDPFAPRAGVQGEGVVYRLHLETGSTLF